MIATESHVAETDQHSSQAWRAATVSKPADITLRTYALAALATTIVGDARATTDVPEVEFLLEVFNAVTREGVWTESLAANFREPNKSDVPLIECARVMGLTAAEVLAVALTAAVEDDIIIGRILARLQSPVGGSRPMLGLLASAFSAIVPKRANVLDIFHGGVAVRSGFLVLANGNAPLPEQTLKVPLHLCQALNGSDGAVANTSIGSNHQPIPLPASLIGDSEKHARALATAPRRVLVLRTGFHEEGRAVAELIAKVVGRRALFLENESVEGLGPWLLMRRLLPVFSFELGPSDRRALPSIPSYEGPVLALCGPDGSVDSRESTVMNWSIPVPAVDERQDLWTMAIGDSQIAARLARDHRHGSGRIAQLGRLAHHHGRLQGRDAPALADVVAASWSGEGVGLEALAQPITNAIPDEALITAPALTQELNTFLARCRSRDGLAEGLGASAQARYRPGVRALFVGPSGTGKTMAAGWLARKLALPLYRIDLASIVSKYIGETEKNLAQLLARAERAEVVLLFDEADSLFGKRTDVREANDRFANTQTNYLLQRIESFDGIAILTSNSRNRFDEAFTRRLDMIVDFPFPSPEERRSLWQSHLGTNHLLDQKSLNQLAVVADLSGGHIRNVVLTAAVLARAEERAIAFADVIDGLASEYRKLGRQMPVELRA